MSNWTEEDLVATLSGVLLKDEIDGLDSDLLIGFVRRKEKFPALPGCCPAGWVLWLRGFPKKMRHEMCRLQSIERYGPNARQFQRPKREKWTPNFLEFPLFHCALLPRRFGVGRAASGFDHPPWHAAAAAQIGEQKKPMRRKHGTYGTDGVFLG